MKKPPGQEPPPAAPTQLDRRMNDAALLIGEIEPDRPEYLHALLCHVGLPRSRQQGRTFERATGRATLLLQAGHVHDGRGFVAVPLPFGPMPRLVLLHLCSEAMRTRSRTIDVRGGVKPFLRRLGIPTGGSTWASFRRQMASLGACVMYLGWTDELGHGVNTKSSPLERFSAWSDPGSGQPALWDDEIVLSHEFFETLRQHAVPLDPRAVGALQQSSLALDAYAWLAHRLRRVRTNAGERLTWENLRDQFGHEYADLGDFRPRMKKALAAALKVYPDARVSLEEGGLRLHSSPPPIPSRNVMGVLPSRASPTAEPTPATSAKP